MKKNIVLIHGFNVRDDGKGTIDRLKRFLNDHDLFDTDYGWSGLLTVLFRNDNIARVVKGLLPKYSVVGIGHSNGCAILLKAAQLGGKFDKLILINPALKRDITIPETVKKVEVIHTKHDVPVRLANLLKQLIPMRDFLWGDMGRVGYLGSDPRVTNHNVSDVIRGHSDIFKPHHEHWFKPWIQELVR